MRVAAQVAVARAHQAGGVAQDGRARLVLVLEFVGRARRHVALRLAGRGVLFLEFHHRPHLADREHVAGVLVQRDRVALDRRRALPDLRIALVDRHLRLALQFRRRHVHGLVGLEHARARRAVAAALQHRSHVGLGHDVVTAAENVDDARLHRTAGIVDARHQRRALGAERDVARLRAVDQAWRGCRCVRRPSRRRAPMNVARSIASRRPASAVPASRP